MHLVTEHDGPSQTDYLGSFRSSGLPDSLDEQRLPRAVEDQMSDDQLSAWCDEQQLKQDCCEAIDALSEVGRRHGVAVMSACIRRALNNRTVAIIGKGEVHS